MTKQAGSETAAQGTHRSGLGPIGPRTAAFLLACAGVATGQQLGASWLEQTSLAVPAGMWVVALAVVGTHAWLKASAWRAYADRSALGTDGEPRGFVDWLAFRAEMFLSRSGSRVLPAADALHRATGRASQIRIGLDLRQSDARSLIGVRPNQPAGGMSIRWERVSRRERSAPEVCAQLGLDALIGYDDVGSIRIWTPESGPEGPGWDDWAVRRKLSYAGVFPARFDPALVTLGWVDLREPREADLVVRLAECAAVLARCPGRVSLLDRLRGRSPLGTAAGTGDSVDKCMLGLAETLGRSWDKEPLKQPGERSPAACAAARAVLAWMSSRDADAPVHDEERMSRGLEVAAELLDDEPESWLRLTAVRFAEREIDKALVALKQAASVLDESDERPSVDPLAFVQSELELGAETTLTAGRVAAGLCLTWMTAAETSLDYLRDDLLEDMQYAGWLVGRDYDHTVLKMVIRELQELRPATSLEADADTGAEADMDESAPSETARAA